MEQSVNKRKYNSQVLIGNWYEDNCYEEHKLAMYCKQKERKNLLVIGIRNLFENFLTPVPLTLRTSGLAYGDTILLAAPDVRSYPFASKEKGIVLAATIQSKDIEHIQCIIDDLNIVGSPIKSPCNRNAFVIESCENKKAGDEVCYGDTITLKSACGSQVPLYINLISPSLGSPAGRCGFPNPSLTFSKSRDSRDKRATCFDLQTFTVHFPANSFKRISLGKPGNYPIALIPGQNTDYYKQYTSNELKYFPLNTVLYGPLRPNERHLQLPGGSDGSQSEIDDSSSSDESSSSSSEETQDTEETNSTVEDDGAEVKTEKIKIEKPIEVEEKEAPKPVKSTSKTPKGRGRGKLNPPDPNQPKKRLGRPPKIKVPVVEVKRVDGEETTEMKKEEKVDISSRVIIHTCKMCHEEETKNKNGEFESFIECAQCNGKIHPSCIDLTPDMIPKISSYGWQCTDCKSCVKCGQSSNEDKMIFCDQCDRGYHIFCVGLSEVPSGNYICVVCKPSTPVTEIPPPPVEKDLNEEENSDSVAVKSEEGISEKK